jgi:hypothetical protein
MGARAVIVNLAASLSGNGLQKAQKELANVGKSVNSLADKVRSAAGAFVGLQAAQAGGRFLIGSIEQARDLERNMAALNTVFQEVAPQFDNFLKAVRGNRSLTGRSSQGICIPRFGSKAVWLHDAGAG